MKELTLLFRSFLALSFLGIGIILNAQLPVLNSADFSDAKYDTYILSKRMMDLLNVPGMAITVSYQGEIVYQEGFGYEDIEKRIYIRPDTSIFRLADISKCISSVMLMAAVENEKLDLTENINKYVKYYPKKKYPINLSQLACHTAGVRPLEGDEKVIDRNFDSIKKGISLFRKDKIVFKPRTDFLYSDHGWSLIGACIEHAYGYDFRRIISDRLIDPMNIDNIYLEGFSDDIPNMTRFYSHDQNSDIKLAVKANYSHVSPGMAFTASSNALAEFANQLLFSSFLEEKTMQKMLKPCTIKSGKKFDYALGWMVNSDDQGRKWFGHSGSGIGASGNLLIYPDYDLVVVVLLNLTEAKIRDLPFKVAQQFIEVIENNQ